MFDVATGLPSEQTDSLLPYACVRGLIAASAHDHRLAESQRRTSRGRTQHPGRSARLSRSAARADYRAAELMAEVR